MRFHQRLLNAHHAAAPVHPLSSINLTNLLTLVFSAIAAVGALVVILTWFLDNRRTPEVTFSLSANGVDWPMELSDDTPALPRFGHLSVDLVLTNVGRGSAENVIVNFVAPNFVDISAEHENAILQQQSATDPVCGTPDDQVRWVWWRVREFYPGLSSVKRLSLAIPPVLRGQQTEDHYFVAISVEAVRLPGRARRSLPSLVGPKDFWAQRDFPGKKYRQHLQRIDTEPRAHVRSGPGRRQHRRPVKVAPQDRQ